LPTSTLLPYTTLFRSNADLRPVVEPQPGAATRQGDRRPAWLRGQPRHTFAYQLRLQHLSADAREHRARTQSVQLHWSFNQSVLPTSRCGRGSFGSLGVLLPDGESRLLGTLQLRVSFLASETRPPFLAQFLTPREFNLEQADRRFLFGLGRLLVAR